MEYCAEDWDCKLKCEAQCAHLKYTDYGAYEDCIIECEEINDCFIPCEEDEEVIE